MHREQERPSGKEMESLQLAAQLIMEHGGETYRAEETVRRMGQGFGLQDVESFAVPSGLFISYRDAQGNLQTSIKRVHRGETDLALVDRTNQISRDAAERRITPEETARRLHGISHAGRPKAILSPLLAAAVCAGGFAFLFQGGVLEALCCMAIAALVQGVGLLFHLMHDQGLVSLILGGMLTALLPQLAAYLIPWLNTEAVVAGALMPLVPGLAMTNAVQDTLRGDMVSGLSHGVSALLTAFLIAGGALLAPALLRILQGGGL